MQVEKQRALREGRKRWEREQHRAAIQRVATYKRWLKAGSPLRQIPEIPSDTDYARWEAARGARKP